MDRQLSDSLREAYDRAAEKREQGTVPLWKTQEREQFLSWLEKENKCRLLEIGAGTGKDGLFFQAHGLQVVCVDLSPENVRLCQEKGLTALEMDLMNLDFPVSSFDAVYAFNSLLHVPKAQLNAVLVRIREVLRPSGLFYYGVWGGIETEGVYEGDDYEPKRFFALYGDEHIQTIVSAFFDLLDFKSVPTGQPELHFQSMILRRPL
jgi:SAM-dependent methyltransferase